LPAAVAFGIVQNATLHSQFLQTPVKAPRLRDPLRVRGKLASFGCALWVAVLTCACARTVEDAPTSESQVRCLPSGDGYVRARLSGSIETELDWTNEGTECTGAVRPDGGLRLRFSRFDPQAESKIVLVFGVANLKEGQSANVLPVNVTIIREGAGEFYSTQGDDKCMLDEVHQAPVVGPPHRTRTYRVVARGFCTEPARAVQGKGAILISRFDFAGSVDFESEDALNDHTIANL
jgi:hypothetical protein